MDALEQVGLVHPVVPAKQDELARRVAPVFPVPLDSPVHAASTETQERLGGLAALEALEALELPVPGASPALLAIPATLEPLEHLGSAARPVSNDYFVM